MMRLLVGSMLVLAALGGCGEDRYATMRDPYTTSGSVPPMDSSRSVSDQDCSKGADGTKGNIRCK